MVYARKGLGIIIGQLTIFFEVRLEDMIWSSLSRHPKRALVGLLELTRRQVSVAGMQPLYATSRLQSVGNYVSDEQYIFESQRGEMQSRWLKRFR